jgi:hypothetical protein
MTILVLQLSDHQHQQRQIPPRLPGCRQTGSLHVPTTNGVRPSNQSHIDNVRANADPGTARYCISGGRK